MLKCQQSEHTHVRCYVDSQPAAGITTFMRDTGKWPESEEKLQA
jgi:hypothetical protein